MNSSRGDSSFSEASLHIVGWHGGGDASYQKKEFTPRLEEYYPLTLSILQTKTVFANIVDPDEMALIRIYIVYCSVFIFD